LITLVDCVVDNVTGLRFGEKLGMLNVGPVQNVKGIAVVVQIGVDIVQLEAVGVMRRSLGLCGSGAIATLCIGVFSDCCGRGG
jgi:hypothetical protein